MITKKITLHRVFYSGKDYAKNPVGFDPKYAIIGISEGPFMAFSSKEEADRWCEQMNKTDPGYSTQAETHFVFDTAEQCEEYKDHLWKHIQAKRKIQDYLERATPEESARFLEAIEKMLHKPT